ncbi:MAG: hypothetical protein Q9181_003794, partial [Wetmoreana brouardii]
GRRPDRCESHELQDMSNSTGRTQEGDESQAAPCSGNGRASETTGVPGVGDPSRGGGNSATTVPPRGADTLKSRTPKDARTLKGASTSSADTPNGAVPRNHADESGLGDASHEGSTLAEAGPSRSVGSSSAGQHARNADAAANIDNASAPDAVGTAPQAGAASETVAAPNANAPVEAAAGPSAPGPVGLVDGMIDCAPAWVSLQNFVTNSAPPTQNEGVQNIMDWTATTFQPHPEFAVSPNIMVGRTETLTERRARHAAGGCSTLVTTWPRPLTGWDTRRTSSIVYPVPTPCTDAQGYRPKVTTTGSARSTTRSSNRPAATNGASGDGDDELSLAFGLGLGFGSAFLICLLVVVVVGYRKRRKAAVNGNDARPVTGARGNDNPNGSGDTGGNGTSRGRDPSTGGTPGVGTPRGNVTSRENIAAQGGTEARGNRARGGSHTPRGNGAPGGHGGPPNNSAVCNNGAAPDSIAPPDDDGPPNNGVPTIMIGLDNDDGGLDMPGFMPGGFPSS